MARDLTGIRTRHSTLCNSHQTGANGTPRKCNCEPSYLPEAWDRINRRKVRGPVCPSLSEALDERDMLRAKIRAETRDQPRRRRAIVEAPLWDDVASACADAIQNEVFMTRQGTQYKPSTARSLVTIIRSRLLCEDFGLVGKRLDEIRPHDIERIKTKLAVKVDKGGAGLGPNSIRRHLDVIGVVWRYAYEMHGFDEACPTDRVRRPTAKPKRQTITEQTAIRMLGALPEQGPERAIYYVALFTGMRRGEILGLRWERIDFEANELHVAETWNPDTRSFGEPKSDESGRTIPFDDILRKELIRWRLESGRSTGLVFTLNGHRPVDSAAVVRKVERRFRAAGITATGFHVCRRAFATFLATQGNDAFTIQKLMGHADISTTAMYIAERPAAKRAAVKGLSEIYQTA